MSDREQSREALRRAGRKFERKLVEGIADREIAWYMLRIKLDRGKVTDCQITIGPTEEQVRGFKIEDTGDDGPTGIDPDES